MSNAVCGRPRWNPRSRTSARLNRDADLVIIGAGLSGLAAARLLPERAVRCVVLDKEPLGWGASSRNGGMVIPELKAGPTTLRKKYGERGRAMFEQVNEAFDFVEHLTTGPDGIDCDYRRTGMLMLAHSPFQVSYVQHEADDMARHGQPAHFVRKEQLQAEVGSSAFAAGMVLERTGGLHPAKFHEGMARRALAAGAADPRPHCGNRRQRPRRRRHRWSPLAAPSRPAMSSWPPTPTPTMSCRGCGAG